MRTVPFKSVYESILRRMGYDPFGDAVKQDVAQNVLQHINDRVRFVWPVAEFPELNAVEWRVFRTIWTSALQFNIGDDLYYLGDGVTPPQIGAFDPPLNYPGPNVGYYNCKAAGPPGTLPTNVTYFTKYGSSTLLPALTDRYIAYSQINQNTIGEVLTVYPQNPREVRWSKIIRQAPSSKGVDVRTGLDAVWIRYRIPPSQFTLTPFLNTGVFPVTYYDPNSGDCYTMSSATFSPLTTFFGGTLIPMPVFLSGYIRAAAYSDAVMETTMEAKMRMVVAQAAQQEALEYLQREIDILSVQGHKEYYPAFPSKHRHDRRVDIAPGAVPVEVFPPGFTGS
jgi:hypothetical protein